MLLARTSTPYDLQTSRERIAMNLIGTGLRDYVQCAAGQPSVLDAHVAGLGAEFLNGIWEREIEILIH